MPLRLAHGNVLFDQDWSSFSGTYLNQKYATWCRLARGDDVSILRKHAEDLSAVLTHCFTQDPPATLRVVGSGWSFSSVLEPGEVGVDAGGMTFMYKPTPDQISAAYAPRRTAGFVPVYFQGGREIGFVNRRLAKDRLALQTSGAGDGHRIAGCIATGTHGSALKIGALHDTVLALHVMTGPNRAVLVQAQTNAPFTTALAAWLEQQTGIPTRDLPDDDAFHAALVSLGSLGVVFGVVVEAEPLYRFRVQRFSAPIKSTELWNAIDTLDTRALHPTVQRQPDHFDVLINPYPDRDGRPMMFGTLMWKEQVPANTVITDPSPGIPRSSTDTMGFTAKIAQKWGNPLTAALARPFIQSIVMDQLAGDHQPPESVHFPGEIFGPTTLPRHRGTSTEIVVDRVDAKRTLETVLDVIESELWKGHFYLGVVAARFVPKTNALLGMNQAAMNCFIELPSIRSRNVEHVYRQVWKRLDDERIRFACHWGQTGDFEPQRVQAYYGNNAARWTAARDKILESDPVAKQVFASGMLAVSGL